MTRMANPRENTVHFAIGRLHSFRRKMPGQRPETPPMLCKDRRRRTVNDGDVHPLRQFFKVGDELVIATGVRPLQRQDVFGLQPG